MENEEHIFQQTVEWLSTKLSCTPSIIRQQTNGFHIDPFTRTFTSENGEKIYLTAKEFDLLYFIFCHKGQVFTKEQLYENIWGFNYITDCKYLTLKKIEKSRELIKDGSLNLTQIAEMLSYDSIQSFSRVFKRVVGMSPSAYMKYEG